MNPRKKFGDFLPPSRKQNPLATRKLKAKDDGLVDQDTKFSDFAPPQQPSREVSAGRMALVSSSPGISRSLPVGIYMSKSEGSTMEIGH